MILTFLQQLLAALGGLVSDQNVKRAVTPVVWES